MPRPAKIVLILLAALALQSCGDKPKETIELVRQQIADYKADPTETRQHQVEASFALLDAQIEKLENSNRQSEAQLYRASEENLRADFRSARMLNSLRDAQSAVEDVGNAFKDAGRSIGDAFREVTGRPSPEPAATP